MARDFAEGYHRRHVCISELCGFGFYTLASYTKEGAFRWQPKAFTDRPLTVLERQERIAWAKEDFALEQASTGVAGGFQEHGELHAVVTLCMEALDTPQDERTPAQILMAQCAEDMLVELRELTSEVTSPEEETNDDEADAPTVPGDDPPAG